LSSEDWLVACGGFEDRALSVLQSASTRGSNVNLLLINYLPVVEQNKSDVIRSIALSKNIKVLEASYDRQEPTGLGEAFIEKVGVVQGRLFIDISGMSRLLIVQILVSLSRRPTRFNNCYIVYTEAAGYPPSESEALKQLSKSELDPSYSIYFLSSGVYEVTLIPELSSCAPAGGQIRLVAFPSLDSHQLTALRSELQPSRISFIEGVPPGAHNRWRQKAIASVNRLDEMRSAERYLVSTLNYEETLECLLKVYSQHGVYERIVISPTGSKMQAVAVGLFRAFIEDAQIVYPTPRNYLKPQQYTEGVGRTHLLRLEAFSHIK
jgi:hypothetical protein